MEKHVFICLLLFLLPVPGSAADSSDNFNRGSGTSLGSGWSEDNPYLSIAGNAVTGDTSNKTGIAHHAASTSNITQYAKIRMSSTGADGEIGSLFRSGSSSGYRYALAYEKDILSRLAWQRWNWNTYVDDINAGTKTLAAGENVMHAAIYAKGKFWTGTMPLRPAKLLRFNEPGNLNDYDVLTFPNDSKHDDIFDIVYSSAKDKIYVIFSVSGQVTVSEVDPDSTPMTYADVVEDAYEASAMSAETDESYLYVVTYTPSRILKYSLADWSKTSANLSHNAGFSLVYDGTNLYATGLSYWINKINPSTLSITYALLNSSDTPIADDIASAGNYVYVCNEGTSGYIDKVKKSDLTYTRIDTGITSRCFGTFYDGTYVWAVFTHYDAPGEIARLDPTDDSITKYTFKPEEIVPNEMAFGSGKTLVTFYTNPAKINVFDSFANGGTLSATIQGTGTGTIIKAWKNTAENAPHDANNWDSASDPPDYVLTDKTGALSSNPADTGLYVGIAVKKEAGSSPALDDFYGGDAAASGARGPADFYVDCGANPGGNGSLETPWDRIGDVNAASFVPDDNIYFRRGCAWREQLTVPSSGASGHTIIFGAYGTGNKPIIDAENTRDHCIILDGRSYITIENLDVRRTANANGGHIKSHTYCSYITIDNCDITGGTDSRQGIVFWTAAGQTTTSNIIISNNAISAINMGNSIDINGADDGGNPATPACTIHDIDIHGNTITGNNGSTAAGNGIYVAYLASGTNAIHGNIIKEVSECGIWGQRWSGGINNIYQNEVHDYAEGTNDRGGIHFINCNGGAYSFYSNYVHDHDATLGTAGQSAGLYLDTFLNTSAVSAYANRIHNTKGAGIRIVKTTGAKVYSNILNQTGREKPPVGNGASLEIIANDYTPSGNADSNLIYNNAIYNNEAINGYGIHIYLSPGTVTADCEGNIIKNNIISHARNALQEIIKNEVDSTMASDANLFYPMIASNLLEYNGGWHRSITAWNALANAGTDYNADPKFMNASNGNFALRADSPAIDAGTPVGLTQDFEGTPVPQGLAPDIGAYEFSGYHRSDTNEDRCVETVELSAFIDLWNLNSQDVTIRELMEAIGLWKSGC